MSPRTSVLCIVSLAASIACGQEEPAVPPVATPSLKVSANRVALGSPVDITYRFAVASDAPAFTKDYLVMVHVLDSDEEMMWTFDHTPEIPTREWKPGQVIEYTRTEFVPVFPYLGTATVEMGLYAADTGERLPLSGEDSGQRAYRVGTLELLPQTENIFVIFKEGWHSPETAENNPTVEWYWTKKDATLSMRNPKRDVLFYVHADHPGTIMLEPQHVTIAIGGQQIDEFMIEPHREVIRKVPLTAAQLGPGDTTEIAIHVDKTFVPALIAPGKTKDSRELGLRVFHAFLQPR